MTRRIFGILGLSSLCVSITACSTTMEGRVTEVGGSSPVSGARVQVGEPVGITDTQGRYVIELGDDTTYDAIVSAPGYETQTQRIRIGDVDDLSVDFALTRLQSETAKGERNLENSRQRAPDVRVDVRSSSTTQRDADQAEQTLPASAKRRLDGRFEGTLRTVAVKPSSKGGWLLADLTVSTGRSVTLAFEEGLDPTSLGLKPGAEVSVEGHHAIDDDQRVLIVDRLSVDGMTRLRLAR